MEGDSNRLCFLVWSLKCLVVLRWYFVICHVFDPKTSKNQKIQRKPLGPGFRSHQTNIYRLFFSRKKKTTQNRRPKKANIEEDRFGHSAVQLQGHQALQVRGLERLNLCDWSNPVRLVCFSFFLGAGKNKNIYGDSNLCICSIFLWSGIIFHIFFSDFLLEEVWF